MRTFFQKKFFDLFLASGVVGLLLLLIVPLPPVLLDLLLSLSIVFAVMTLLLTLYLEDSLEFSSFPSLLLFLTLFRLGLNIASTRMILTRGEGGGIIATFGAFVTAGSVGVGCILFLLLTVINFIVVTKGAGRIAEVAARFNLEALPGKQSAIDGEMAAGVVTQEEAKRARVRVNAEADFYGAMDGASKFVRGDAIASVVITVVNIVGGLAFGFFVKGYGWGECFALFTKLTIGDGLVSQIPALLISVGAGIMVTRASKGSVGRALPAQVLQNPQVVAIAAAVLFALSCVPGMPLLVMAPLVALLGAYAYVLYKRKGKGPSTPQTEESVESVLVVHPLEVRLGFKWLTHAAPLLDQVPAIRRKVASRLGVVIPSLHIGDSQEIPPRAFQVCLKGVPLLTEEGGDFASLVKRVTDVICVNAHELLTRQDVAHMIEKAKVTNGAVVEELIPAKLTIGMVLKVLQNLLKEGVSIRDFGTILEVLADYVPAEGTPNLDGLTERVRQGLARGIASQLFGPEKKAHVITLEPQVEQMFTAALQKGAFGTRLALRPATSEKIRTALEKLHAQASEEGKQPVVVTDVTTRPHLRQLIEKQLPTLPVLSYPELTSDVEVHTLGVLSNEVLI